MSGGGNKPSSGRIGCRVVEKVDRKVVEKQEEELNEDIEKLEVSKIGFKLILVNFFILSWVLLCIRLRFLRFSENLN